MKRLKRVCREIDQRARVALRGKMRGCPQSVFVLVMTFATVLAPASAAVQRASASCAECQPIADQIQELERKWDEANKLFVDELGETMSLRRANIDDEVLISEIRSTAPSEAGARSIKEIEARIAAREPAIKEHEARANHHSRQAAALRTEIAKLSVTLEFCNRQCKVPPSMQPPIGTGGAPTPPSTETNPVDANGPVPTPECPACKDVADGLSRLQAQRRGALGTLQTIDGAHKLRLAEEAALAAQLAKLQQANPNARPGSLGVEDRLEAVREHLEQLEAFRSFWEGEVKRLEEEISRVRDEFERCNKLCKPPTQTGGLFNRKTVLVAGAIGGGLLISGRDGAPTSTVSSPAPIGTPSNTTNPSPNQTPAPTRRPASALTVNGYLCVDNAAVLDGILQLCQRLRQIRTQGSGNSIVLTGAAPLPAFQGRFNESTGAFELTATTTVGTTTASVVIAGSVEISGNLANLRVGFAGTSGRQTLIH